MHHVFSVGLTKLPGHPSMRRADRDAIAEPGALRPASIVMSQARAGAAVPNAMSFSRAAMRELVRGRWKIEKLKFDLDSEGRGEVLYRLLGGGGCFTSSCFDSRSSQTMKR